jgi:chemotaxis protein MotB
VTAVTEVARGAALYESIRVLGREEEEPMLRSVRALDPVRSALLLGAATLSVAAAPGCVTRGSYEELESERNAIAERVDALEQEREALEKEREALRSRLLEQEAEADRLRGTYDSLVSDLKSELATGQVRIEQLREGIRVNLAQEILFPTGSAQLDDQGREILLKVSNRLKEMPNAIEVEGHTDDVRISSALKSRYPTNWELAAARAARVVRLFQESGIDPTRMTAVSYGPFHPEVPNDSPENRAKNRRIEIKLLPAEDSTMPAEIPD